MKRREILKSAGAAAALLWAAPLAEAQAPAGELTTFWAHGTAFQVEDPGLITTTQRVGWGTAFQGKSGAFTWFHISIPTPTMLGDRHVSVEKIYVLHQIQGARIRNVHVYDGARKVHALDNLQSNTHGDYGAAILPANTWPLNPSLPISFGLGISLGVQYSTNIDSAGGPPMEILFTAAGADFRTNTQTVNLKFQPRSQTAPAKKP